MRQTFFNQTRKTTIQSIILTLTSVHYGVVQGILAPTRKLKFCAKQCNDIPVLQAVEAVTMRKSWHNQIRSQKLAV